jgi:hypothetical protein
MSYRLIVGGKITKTTGGDHKMYSEGDIVLNSAKTITITGKQKGVSFGKPKKAPPLEKISLAKVEFRTLPTYKGEFGFDWLRIDDGALTLEPAYETIVESGYKNATIAMTKSEAQKALKKEYNKISVKKPTPPDGVYYVPWLNLFPKPYSDTIKSTPKLPYEAELKILIQVDGPAVPDQIRVEFNKNYFVINGKDGTDAHPVLITDKKIGAKRKAKDTLKIKCIAEFSANQEIKVYAYPKGSAGKTKAELMSLKKLVGKIIVCTNDEGNRKVQKFVFVKVKTNTLGQPKPNTGSFNLTEKTNFYNALYQGLIFPKSNLELRLDVTKNPNFKAGTKYADAAGRIIRTEPTLNSYMRQLVNKATANKYSGCFFVFCFDIEDSSQRVGGRVEEIGKKSVVLYKGRDNYTLNHEVLHGLGLLHTHNDGAIDNVNQKYTYPHANTTPANATDNVMSYQPDGKTTWHWQWKIIKKNIV